ncbi:MAG: hypothetical protein J6P03_00700 [Opitutales bacterium]|nr:hypothetical protein [Opitutales bacterium]
MGYPFAASLLVPLGYSAFQSQTVTVPYRIIALAVAAACVLIGFHKKGAPPRKPKMVIFYFFCFAMCIMRVFLDFLTDQTGYAQIENIRVWGLIVSSLFSALSVYFTFKFINFRSALFISICMATFVMTVNKFGFNQTSADLLIDFTNIRQTGSDALFSIAYSMVGVVSAIICLYVLFSKDYNIIYKAAAIPVLLVSLGVMASAGSRGPVLALALALVFWFASGIKNKAVFFFFAFCGFISIYLLRYQIVDLLVEYVPLLGNRFDAMLYANFYSGRDILIYDGLQQCFYNPILGSSTINPETGVTTTIGYHTALVDALAYFGIIGGSLIIALIFYMLYIAVNMVSKKNIIPDFWIVMILLATLIFKIIASGLFHVDPAFSALIVLGICFYSEFYPKPDAKTI